MNTATDCGCDTRVTTWADGFGVWHATVPAGKSAAHVARRAIKAELSARGELGSAPLALTLVSSYAGALSCCPRVEYAEYAS